MAHMGLFFFILPGQDLEKLTAAQENSESFKSIMDTAIHMP
jgi:hypothetical protein